MRYLKGFYMSLGMFCSIPLPFHIWDEKYMGLMISSFPLVGAVIGVIWWLVGLLLFAIGAPLMLTAAILALAPFLIAGFIHLDGYMDTSDALLSSRPLEDKMRILVDPRVGAFAVIMLMILLLFQFAAMHTVAEVGRYLALVISISVISRCCSTFSIFTLRHTSQSHYAPLLAQHIRAPHKIFIVLLAIAVFVLSFLYAGLLGLFVLGAVVLGYACAIAYAYKGFKGISGDLLGYAMVIAELCGLFALAFIQVR